MLFSAIQENTAAHVGNPKPFVKGLYKMGNKPGKPMPISERAKQFSPFAAVAGLDKALTETERAMMKTEKRELSEDDSEKLNKILSELKKGDSVKAEYYCDGEYLTAEGIVTLLDKINRDRKSVV